MIFSMEDRLVGSNEDGYSYKFMLEKFGETVES